MAKEAQNDKKNGGAFPAKEKTDDLQNKWEAVITENKQLILKLQETQQENLELKQRLTQSRGNSQDNQMINQLKESLEQSLADKTKQDG